jgi:hypothetical protein
MQKALRIVAHHLPPLLFLVWLYVVFLGRLVMGAGPVFGIWPVVSQTSALLLGLPDAGVFRDVAAAIELSLTVLGVVRLAVERDRQWPFYLAVLAAAPALLLAVAQPQYLYFRYFLVCFPFFLLLLGFLVCQGWRRLSGRWRWGPVVLMLALVVAQIPRDYRLLELGRGQYSAALKYMSENSGEGIAWVGSDHDFRNWALFEFYAPRVAPKNNLRYVKEPQWPANAPDWYLTHSQEETDQPAETLTIKGAGSYRLVKIYRYGGISGWNWFLYRRQR